MKKKMFVVVITGLMFFAALLIVPKFDTVNLVPSVYAEKGKGKGKGQDKDKKDKKDKDKGPSVPGIPMAAAILVGLGAIGIAGYFIVKKGCCCSKDASDSQQ